MCCIYLNVVGCTVFNEICTSTLGTQTQQKSEIEQDWKSVSRAMSQLNDVVCLEMHIRWKWNWNFKMKTTTNVESRLKVWIETAKAVRLHRTTIAIFFQCVCLKKRQMNSKSFCRKDTLATLDGEFVCLSACRVVFNKFMHCIFDQTVGF